MAGETENIPSVKKVLDEDEDKIVSVEEIARIFRIYLGRPATEEENSRFEGIKESEWKILQKYVERQQDIVETQEKGQFESSKNAQDFAVKDAKITGKNILDTKKMASTMPGTMPMATSPAPMPMMPQDPNAMSAPATEEMPPEGGQEYLQDGDNFLIKFKNKTL